MPKLNMARIRELADKGYSDDEIAADPDVLTEEEQAQRSMAASTAALHNDASPPDQMPDKPVGIRMMEAAFAEQGGRARPSAGMSDAAMKAGFDELFAAANRGDPGAVFKAPDESWQAAKERWDNRRR